jgi:hypothetical protein
MPLFNGSRRTRLLAGALGVGLACGTVGLISISNAAEPTPTARAAATDAAQIPQVEAVFTAAIQADRAAQAPEASTAYGKSVSASLAAGQVVPAVTDAVRQQQLRDGVAQLGRYFAPAQAEHEAIGLRNAVSAEADPAFRNLGSGASKVEYVQVAVANGTATVQAKVTAWAKFQQLQPDGTWTTANPVNVMVYNAHLGKDASGHWVINSMQGDFAPGEGP